MTSELVGSREDALPESRCDKPFHRIGVISVERLCVDAVAITFQVPPLLVNEFSFKPGQSVTVRRTIDGIEHRRCYSICAAAGTALRIGVRQIPDGILSGWLVNEIRSGDELEVQPPSGTFGADAHPGGRHVLIAAGSGITPILSIAASMLQNSHSQVILLYGNRTTSSIMFIDELCDLKNTYGPRLQLVHVLSREPRGVDLFSGRLDGGRITQLLRNLVPVSAIDHFWLCGPFGMVTSARQVLNDLGVSPRRIHQELFFAPSTAATAVARIEAADEAVSDVTIRMDGSITTLTLPRRMPVLDGAQRSRADLPFACKSGICGTCRAKVTAGHAEMRQNFALDGAEVDDGYVLTCQSFPVSATLTIDFDS